MVFSVACGMVYHGIVAKKASQRPQQTTTQDRRGAEEGIISHISQKTPMRNEEKEDCAITMMDYQTLRRFS